MSLAQAVKVIPFFSTPSVSRLLDFYRTVLPEFQISIDPPGSEHPTFASICAGPKAAVNIYVIEDGRGSPTAEARARARGSCMIMLSALKSVDDMYQRLVALTERTEPDPASEAGVTSSGAGFDRVEQVEWTGVPSSSASMIEGEGERGATTRWKAVIGPIEDQPWGYRQFDLVDPAGNLLVFFAFLDE